MSERDEDPFVSCPFDPAHRVPRSRIQRHIVKCQKNYPHYKACPYNATHRFPPEAIKAHVLNCPFKAKFALRDLPTLMGHIPKQQQYAKKEDSDDDWDD